MRFFPNLFQGQIPYVCIVIIKIESHGVAYSINWNVCMYVLSISYSKHFFSNSFRLTVIHFAHGMCKPHYGHNDFFFRWPMTVTLYVVIIKKTPLRHGNYPIMDLITENGSSTYHGALALNSIWQYEDNNYLIRIFIYSLVLTYNSHSRICGVKKSSLITLDKNDLQLPSFFNFEIDIFILTS